MKYFPPPPKKAFLHHRSRSSEPGHPTDPLSRGEERSLSCNTPRRPASHKSHVCGGRKKKQQLNLHPRRSRCPSALSAPTHYPFFRRRASVPHVAARSSPPTNSQSFCRQRSNDSKHDRCHARATAGMPDIIVIIRTRAGWWVGRRTSWHRANRAEKREKRAAQKKKPAAGSLAYRHTAGTHHTAHTACLRSG